MPFRRPAGASSTQAGRALALVERRTIVGGRDFAQAGVNGVTLTRLVEAGRILRVGRGLYQRADAPIETNHNLALACKQVPQGVVCLTSALAFYGLTDHIPAAIYLAIPKNAWRPSASSPPVQGVRFSGVHFTSEIEHHRIEGVDVKVYSLTKTIVDLFRCERMVGRNIALEGLRNGLQARRGRVRLTAPAKIAEYALKVRVYSRIEPYLAAYTAAP